MLIKSKTHKDPRLFRKMVEYIFFDKGRASPNQAWSYFHNLSEFEVDKIVEAFRLNDSFRPHRKNGVAMRHLIISFNPLNTSFLKDRPEVIQDLVNKFLELRGEKGVVFGRLHEHDGHMHVHLLVSGNQYLSPLSTRMSKKDFQEVQKRLEEYQMRRYPELSESIVKSIPNPKLAILRETRQEEPKVFLSEQELKIKERLQDKPTKKEALKKQLEELLRQAENTKSFYDLLEENGFTIYKQREKIRGFLKDGKKFRFATVGVSDTMMRGLDIERKLRLDLHR